MARLVKISKIRVDIVPPPWSAGWETRYFKVVISCAGLRVGETRPEQLDTDGCFQWAEHLQLSTRGRSEGLIAKVISSRTSGGGSWCLVPGCRFEIFSVKAGHSVWRSPSSLPGADPNFRAEVENVIGGDDSEQAAEHVEAFGKRQGAGGHLEASLEGDQRPEAKEYLGTLIEEGRGHGAGEHLDEDLGGDDIQATAEHLETGLVEEKSQGAGEQLQTLLQEGSRQTAGEQLETPLEEDESQEAVDHLETFSEEEKKSEGGAGPPLVLSPETHGGIHFYPVSATDAGTGEWRTTPFFTRDSDSTGWTRGTVDGHGWLGRLEALTTSLAQGRGILFMEPSPSPQWHLSPVQAPYLMQEEGIMSARGPDSRVFSFLSAQSVIGHIDQSMPESAYRSSLRGALMHAVPGRRTGGEEVLQQASERPRWFHDAMTGDSCSPTHGAGGGLFASHPTVARRVMSVISRSLSQARTPSKISHGPTQDSRGTSGSRGLAGCDTGTEEEALVDDSERGRQRAHYPPIRSRSQPETRSESTTSAAGHDSSIGVGDGHVTPRLQQGVHLFKAASPPSGKRKRHGVTSTASSASKPIAPNASIAPPSYEEGMRVDFDAIPPPRSAFPLLPDVGKNARSPVQPLLAALPDVDMEEEAEVERTLRLLRSPSAASVDLPPPSYDSIFAQRSLRSREHTASARSQTRLKDAISGTKGRFLRGGHRGVLESSSMGSAKEHLLTEKSTIPENRTTCIPAHDLNTSHEEAFYTEKLMPRGESSSVRIRRRHCSVSHIAAVARASSLGAVEAAHCSQTETLQPFEMFDNIEDADPGYFTCVSPQSVCGGDEFQLRVSTSSRKVQANLLQTASREEAKEGAIAAGVSGTSRIARGKTVIVKLELPENVFKVLDADIVGANEPVTKRPSSVRDLVWIQIGQQAKFNVACLPGVSPGAVDCGVRLIQTSSSTLLSFRMEVVEAEHASGTSEDSGTAAVSDPRTAVEDVEASSAEERPSEPTISYIALKSGLIDEKGTADPRVSTRSSVACLPSPFLLVNRVDPGPSVHESKEHGFRLTVQDGSLHSPIGPITVQDFAQVVKCENDGQDYLVKTIVDCLPSGASFPDKPLLMDFIVEDASFSEPVQVLVRKGGAGEWRTIKSEVRVDRWGTYLRAAVSDFCRFTWGTKINPSDPARLESCSKKSVIEVQNATEDDIFFVLVPVTFDSDRTSRVTYTGNIAFGVAGSSFGAAAGSGYESAVKSHMLPAGFTPDDISVPAGGKFQFSPPPGASQGKLLVATITEDSEAGLSVKVVVLHGKFNTPEGKRRVILPVCLRSKSRISARLGPHDIPVNMVMIMAGMGSRVTTITEAPSPPSSTASVAPPSTVSPAAVPPRSAQRRGSATQSCPIS